MWRHGTVNDESAATAVAARRPAVCPACWAGGGRKFGGTRVSGVRARRSTTSIRAARARLHRDYSAVNTPLDSQQSVSDPSTDKWRCYPTPQTVYVPKHGCSSQLQKEQNCVFRNIVIGIK